MAKKVLFLGVRWVKTPVNATIVDNVVGFHGDWMRLNSFIWFVYTNSAPSAVFRAVQDKMNTEDSVFVTPVDLAERAGWLPKFAVEWLDDKQARIRRGE